MAGIKTVKYFLTLLLFIRVARQTLHTEEKLPVNSAVFQKFYLGYTTNPGSYLLPLLLIHPMKT